MQLNRIIMAANIKQNKPGSCWHKRVLGLIIRSAFPTEITHQLKSVGMWIYGQAGGCNNSFCCKQRFSRSLLWIPFHHLMLSKTFKSHQGFATFSTTPTHKPVLVRPMGIIDPHCNSTWSWACWGTKPNLWAGNTSSQQTHRLLVTMEGLSAGDVYKSHQIAAVCCCTRKRCFIFI